MATPRTPQRAQVPPERPSAAASLPSPSPSRPLGVSRVQKPQASASPQIKAALAALRKNRQNSPSLNSQSASAVTTALPDPFSTPSRATTPSNISETPASRDTSPTASRANDESLNWAKKNETRLIEAAKKTGLLNFASQGLDKISPAIYSALLPRSSPYHPSRRNRSSFQREPTTSYSFNRDDNETAWFEQCDLKSLNFANNELEAIDEEVGAFEDLEFLDLHGNLLSSIPPSLGYLVHLTSLNLASNAITHFPTQIANLRFLRELNLAHNKLEELWPSTWEKDLAGVLQPPEASPSATPESPERIRDFFANATTRRSQPELASQTSNSPFPLLQSLNLSGNTFGKSTFTSSSFEFPPRLRTLDLSNCELTDAALPPLLVGRLKVLEELDLSENQFTQDLFSRELFATETPEPLFPSLRSLHLSLNPIEHLGSIEDFLTNTVSRPIEYDGLAKVVLNLVKSEEQRLRSGKRIGVRLDSEADVGSELEVRVRECPLEAEQERRRAKFPTSNGVASMSSARPSTSAAPSTGTSPSKNCASRSPSPHPASTASDAAPSGSHSTPGRKQVVLEEWEIEAAAGLTTPAGRRKAAAQAAREQAERRRQEEEEKRRMKDERAKQVQLELEAERQRLAKEEEANLERKMESTSLEETEDETLDTSSPPPYSQHESSVLSQPEDESSLPPPPQPADLADPAFRLILDATNPSSRAVNLSSRSLSTLPAPSSGSPPSSIAVPPSIDLSRTSLTCLPLRSIEIWNWSSTLRTLTITHNRLSSLLDAKTAGVFKPLSAVTTLDLSHNHLTSSPNPTRPLLAEIHDICPSLRTLSLSYNRLTSLDGIDALLLPSTNSTSPSDPSPPSSPSLRALYLNGNKVSDTIALCRVAENVRDNGSSRWTLEELDLRDNEIARLQPTLGLLPHSLILSVSGNTFRFPRREIWEVPGQKLLLPHLRERLG
ncbi:hypothetical protein JCM3766R1_004553 [Sporobolomyces carnicolor]